MQALAIIINKFFWFVFDFDNIRFLIKCHTFFSSSIKFLHVERAINAGMDLDIRQVGTIIQSSL